MFTVLSLSLTLTLSLSQEREGIKLGGFPSRKIPLLLPRKGRP
jgi:hypothetical protein